MPPKSFSSVESTISRKDRQLQERVEMERFAEEARKRDQLLRMFGVPSLKGLLSSLVGEVSPTHHSHFNLIIKTAAEVFDSSPNKDQMSAMIAVGAAAILLDVPDVPEHLRPSEITKDAISDLLLCFIDGKASKRMRETIRQTSLENRLKKTVPATN